MDDSQRKRRLPKSTHEKLWKKQQKLIAEVRKTVKELATKTTWGTNSFLGEFYQTSIEHTMSIISTIPELTEIKRKGS